MVILIYDLSRKNVKMYLWEKTIILFILHIYTAIPMSERYNYYTATIFFFVDLTFTIFMFMFMTICKVHHKMARKRCVAFGMNIKNYKVTLVDKWHFPYRRLVWRIGLIKVCHWDKFNPFSSQETFTDYSHRQFYMSGVCSNALKEPLIDGISQYSSNTTPTI